MSALLLRLGYGREPISSVPVWPGDAVTVLHRLCPTAVTVHERSNYTITEHRENREYSTIRNTLTNQEAALDISTDLYRIGQEWLLPYLFGFEKPNSVVPVGGKYRHLLELSYHNSQQTWALGDGWRLGDGVRLGQQYSGRGTWALLLDDGSVIELNSAVSTSSTISGSSNGALSCTFTSHGHAVTDPATVNSVSILQVLPEVQRMPLMWHQGRIRMKEINYLNPLTAENRVRLNAISISVERSPLLTQSPSGGLYTEEVVFPSLPRVTGTLTWPYSLAVLNGLRQLQRAGQTFMLDWTFLGLYQWTFYIPALEFSDYPVVYEGIGEREIQVPFSCPTLTSLPAGMPQWRRPTTLMAEIVNDLQSNFFV